jgi:hypothetical protein
LSPQAFERRVEPEWLDEMTPEDPRAVRCRRDLRLMNRIMGHAGTISRALRAHVRSNHPRIAELGAGDGTLMLRVARDMTEFSGGELTLIDQQPIVSAETMALYAKQNWDATVRRADVFDWLMDEHAGCDAIVANLFLHHFETPQLAKLLALAERRTTLFVACEPRRARFPLAGSHLVGLLGCNDVTRHDAVLSVRAGFSGEELSQLWPKQDGWRLEETAAGLFSHLFVAEKP